MAIEREIWLQHLVEGLFPDNSVLAKATNLDAFVAGTRVHVPNAGLSPDVKKNRTKGSRENVSLRTDTTTNFDIDSFTTVPMLIPNSDKIQLSYDKRSSVISSSQHALRGAVLEDIVRRWMNGVSSVSTTGAAAVAHTPSATGNRKSMTRQDVATIMVQFNKDDVPAEGRYLLLDAVMYAQLLSDMSESDKISFHASTNAQKGILGELYGFSIMMRSRVAVSTSAGALKEWSVAGATTDLAVGVAFQKESVGTAQGGHKAFSQDGDPTLYGDVVSFEVLAGGSFLRTDKKGVVQILQASV